MRFILLVCYCFPFLRMQCFGLECLDKPKTLSLVWFSSTSNSRAKYGCMREGGPPSPSLPPLPRSPIHTRAVNRDAVWHFLMKTAARNTTRVQLLRSGKQTDNKCRLHGVKKKPQLDGRRRDHAVPQSDQRKYRTKPGADPKWTKSNQHTLLTLSEAGPAEDKGFNNKS